jgi:pyruvate kinase
MRRTRSAKIVATLGPATPDEQAIRALFERGVDVFRLNFSHGSQHDHARRLEAIRRLEQEFGRPIGVLLDLQGPKLRLGTFEGGRAQLEAGRRFRLDMDTKTSGDYRRAPLPHPEIFAALQAGTDLLLDDGKLRLRVESHGAELCGDHRHRRRADLRPQGRERAERAAADFAAHAEGPRRPGLRLSMGVDWVALSFVQRPEDITEAREIIGKRAWIMAKLEKPAAIEHLDGIVALADGIMVARGDLGVELPPEQVPELQRRIVRACRQHGKPVVVATQMLESMIAAPVPTRAEVSDVATAIYDGVDAVMLSAESASGKYPLEAVGMMDRIVARVEGDPSYRTGIDATHDVALSTTADAMCAPRCARWPRCSRRPPPSPTRSSGFTSLRAARERPAVPILSLTPDVAAARRMAMVWGVHPRRWSMMCTTWPR